MTISNTARQELHNLSEEWVAAERHGNTGFLDRTLAPDFVSIGPRGFMLTKEQWLARHTSGDLKYESFALDDVQVRIYDGAAITTGRQTGTAVYQGRAMPGQFRVMLVFVQQHGRWLVAGVQFSPIAEAP